VVAEPRLTRHLVERQSFVNDPVVVVDVGASGGIDSYWDEFQDQLTAVGFDPLVAEVERLNRKAPPNVRYVAAAIVAHEPQDLAGAASTQFFHRSSAVRASEIAALDYIRETYSAGAEPSLTDYRVTLDEYFDDETGAGIDFLKIDTDGHDLDVLLGADRILTAGRVLGLAVEAQFQGYVHPVANLFSNIDTLLRSKGFSLFDLEVHRYSRAALPANFVYDIPAQTTSGQVGWAESFYFRDFGDPHYETTWSFEPELEDILKLACLYEIFGLLDCAAELIIKYRAKITGEVIPTELLDMLAAEQAGPGITYSALLEDFVEKSKKRIWQRS
jgi:FkbM family methyltransferase